MISGIKKAVSYGFLIWLIPFVVAILIFPLKTSSPALFESIMPVIISISVIIFLNLYSKTVSKDFLKEFVSLGLLWFVISIVIDLFMFMWGPMKMSFMDYMKDIGFTYLMIPTITIGVGLILERSNL